MPYEHEVPVRCLIQLISVENDPKKRKLLSKELDRLLKLLSKELDRLLKMESPVKASPVAARALDLWSQICAPLVSVTGEEKKWGRMRTSA
jgi:hypothetical protein